MKKQLQITEEILNHELNQELELEVELESKDCPAATLEGYYVKIGGQCVFVPN